MLSPDTIPIPGQVFIRDAGNGLAMICGIVTLADKLPKETIYPAKVEIYYKSGEDVSKQTIGQTIGGVLMLPLWRVVARKSG